MSAGRSTQKPSGASFVFVLLGINALLMGLLAFSFTQGPFSGHEQELWYRYGSIGFLIAGAVLPGVALWFGALRSQWATVGLAAWMIVTLMAFLVYALLSGGGV